MKRSLFNHIIPYKENRHILVNTLSGALDLVPEQYGSFLSRTSVEEENDMTRFLLDRRYLLEEEVNEPEILKALYKSLQTQKRKNSPLKCVVIVTFDCNLKCSYCWQQHKLPAANHQAISPHKVDMLFEAVGKLSELIKEKSENPPIMQIFGGEPLLEENSALVEYILRKCREAKYNSQFTTNGVNLSSFQKMILEYGVNEIQVTVDGTEDVHNRRRLGSDYRSIMNSLDSLLGHNALYVKLRVNVDLSNVHTLPDLANEIIDRRWYTNRKFYAYLAPLRDCSFDNPVLLTGRNRLLKEIYRQKSLYPQIEVFDMMGWDGYQPARTLQNTGRFPYPKPNICDVNLNQLVFAPDGSIHLCAEEAQGQWDLVGQYYPEYKMDLASFSNIYDSSPLKLEKCRNCTMLPVCGGGCKLISENEQFLKHYCRSVKECFEYGLIEFIEGGGSN